MSYRIGLDETVEQSIRRIAGEQLDKGLSEIGDASIDRHATVHQVRKRCKKLRGLVRLVRPAFEKTYQNENSVFRDAARTVSGIRDAQTLIETYDDLMERFDDQLNRASFGPIRSQLTRTLHGIDPVNIDGRLISISEIFQAAKERSTRWKLKRSGPDAITDGLAKTRQRAVDCLADVRQSASTENLHQLRKRVKYHWYHMRLLRDVWKDVIKTWIDQLDRLNDLLGDDHDLAVFTMRIDELRDGGIDPTDAKVMRGLIDQRRNELQRQALRSARLVFAESTQAFTERLGSYWDLSRKDSPDGAPFE